MTEAIDGDELIRSARDISTATAHEASGRTGVLPAAIKPLAPHMRLCGRALPIRSGPGDNLFLHHAIYAAHPGEVLVVDTSGAREFGYWGEVMALAAQQRGIAGLVIDGGVRDSLRMIEMDFPIFSTGTCVRGTGKDPDGPGSIGVPVRIGEIEVRRGDVVLGDNDGVVIFPQEGVPAIVAESRRRDQQEHDIFARLRGGSTTLAIYDLPMIVSPIALEVHDGR